MKVTQLRSWIRRYGDIGLLVAAAYLGFEFLRKQHKLAVLLALGLATTALTGGFLMRQYSLPLTPVPQTVKNLPEPPLQGILPPSETLPSDFEDICGTEVKVPIGAAVWRFTLH